MKDDEDNIKKNNVDPTPESIKEDRSKDAEETKEKVITEIYRNIYLVDEGAKTPPLGGLRELHCKNCFAGTDMTTIKLGRHDLVLKSLKGINNIIAQSVLWKQSNIK